MRNEDHPLIKALKGRKKDSPVSLPSLSSAPRIFELSHKDFPGLANSKPGDGITVSLSGKIASMHDDGRVTMNVHKVIPPDSEEMDEAEDPDLEKKKTVYVSTQQSHSIS